ncbi:MAG: hypothetical protein NDI62_02360 [Burkholderiales bacterium]|nr:hypothetical protein [Burkholderiales bacterium]
MKKDMQGLIKEAKKIIDKRYKNNQSVVGCAVKTKSGKIYTGVSINAQKINLCSEWITIGQAFSEGDSDIEMVVAVRKYEDKTYEIYPPCALCRELYVTYCPKADVIISEKKMIKADRLLPHAWKKKK